MEGGGVMAGWRAVREMISGKSEGFGGIGSGARGGSEILLHLEHRFFGRGAKIILPAMAGWIFWVPGVLSRAVASGSATLSHPPPQEMAKSLS